MGMFTDYAENKIVDALFRGQALGAPATWYVGLLTTNDNDADSAKVEVSLTNTNYARVPVTASLANFAGTQSAGSTVASSGNSGTTSNNGTIAFNAPKSAASGGVAWGSVVGYAFFDAATGGNAWLYVPLTTPKTINADDPAPSFAPAAISLQVDS